MQDTHDTEGSVRLEGLRWFARAAEAGSLTAAARRAHVAQSTVSRALARLERTLGVELAARSGRTFRLTPAGRALLPHARRVLADLERFERAAVETKGGTAGRVTLSLCTTLGRHVLLPALSAWRDQRWDVRLDVRFEERDLDPRAEGVDLVVRAGRARDRHVRRTVLGDYGHVLVASPRYVASHGAPTHPRDLEEHQVLTIRLERVWSTWPFARGPEAARVEVTPHLVVTHADMLDDLVRAGEGITVLPDFVAAKGLSDGSLVPLLEEWALPRMPAYALHAPRQRLARIVEEVLDTLRDAMRAGASRAAAAARS